MYRPSANACKISLSRGVSFSMAWRASYSCSLVLPAKRNNPTTSSRGISVSPSSADGHEVQPRPACALAGAEETRTVTSAGRPLVELLSTFGPGSSRAFEAGIVGFRRGEPTLEEWRPSTPPQVTLDRETVRTQVKIVLEATCRAPIHPHTLTGYPIRAQCRIANTRDKRLEPFCSWSYLIPPDKGLSVDYEGPDKDVLVIAKHSDRGNIF